MIITVTDAHGAMAKSILAGTLAAQRGRAGRKVLLLDADPRHDACQAAREGAGAPGVVTRAISAKGLQPELEHLSTCYHDIVIDSESRDSLGSRSALIAARVVIVPLEADGDGAARARLVERIVKARMFNPGLRVLVVCGQTSAQERLRVNAFVSSIPAATLSDFDQLYGATFKE